jgi:hypothetical protein
MDSPSGGSGILISLLGVTIRFVGVKRDDVSVALFLWREYGLVGLAFVVAGSHGSLRAAFQVLASNVEQVALDFKAAAQAESAMVAVAVSWPELCHDAFPSCRIL